MRRKVREVGLKEAVRGARRTGAKEALRLARTAPRGEERTKERGDGHQMIGVGSMQGRARWSGGDQGARSKRREGVSMDVKQIRPRGKDRDERDERKDDPTRKRTKE